MSKGLMQDLFLIIMFIAIGFLASTGYFVWKTDTQECQQFTPAIVEEPKECPQPDYNQILADCEEYCDIDYCPSNIDYPCPMIAHEECEECVACEECVPTFVPDDVCLLELNTLKNKLKSPMYDYCNKHTTADVCQQIY